MGKHTLLLPIAAAVLFMGMPGPAHATCTVTGKVRELDFGVNNPPPPQTPFQVKIIAYTFGQPSLTYFAFDNVHNNDTFIPTEYSMLAAAEARNLTVQVQGNAAQCGPGAIRPGGTVQVIILYKNE